ncbi:MAG: alpha/beta hydrolase, partial [Planctomycetota bacterium]|nr:alpha/beta hydrolase [Planctomycetota bacterium]
MRIRTYGTTGPELILIHGGPGAAGGLHRLAQGLEDSFRVIEPWQRRSGGTPLTVARHVDDLFTTIESKCLESRPVLIGHSWGAMLALAYGATHPEHVGPIVLIGCGTFDPESRHRYQETTKHRMTEEARRRIDQVSQTVMNPDERLRSMATVLLPLYSHDLLDVPVPEECDALGHEETWHDMMRLQSEDVYPAQFRVIRGPVLMLHGRDDPHPGAKIRDTLMGVMPQVEYHEWSHCGHYPWLERAV